VIVPCFRESQLREDAVHVLLDRSFGYPETLGDARIRTPLGHEREDLALPRGKDVEGILGALSGHQLLYERRIDD
jgi:hypothetical protein